MEKITQRRKGSAGGFYSLAISANDMARAAFLQSCRRNAPI
jgi:hypothetical protein